MQGALLAQGDPAIEVLADFARREAVLGRTALVVDEGGDAIAATLRARGVAVTTWRRFAVGAEPGRPFPPEGLFERIVLRLPRGRQALAMLAHWLTGHLAPDGELWVAGKNEEGIRSAPATLLEAFSEVESRETRRHCRVLAARLPRADARCDVKSWRQTHEELGRSWVSWPGSFAHLRIDPGTALLMNALPGLQTPDDPFARTVDVGCGIGVLAAAVAALRPGAELVGADADALALEAAKENVPGLEVRCLDASVTLGAGRFTAVVTNPPVHQGSSYDRDLTARVLARAVAALVPGGLLAAVALRGVPLTPLLGPMLSGLSVVSEDSRYRVWVGRVAR